MQMEWIVSQVKRELEAWEDLQMDIRDVALATGALTFESDSDEVACAEVPDAERHTYALVTNLHKRGLGQPFPRPEVMAVVKAVLDEAR